MRGNLIYIAIVNGKVAIEYDGMEGGITQDLIQQGIPADKIVLAFLPESRTAAVV